MVKVSKMPKTPRHARCGACRRTRDVKGAKAQLRRALVDVTGHTAGCTRMTAAEAAAWIEEIVDFHGRGYHGNRELALGAVLPFHNLANSQAAVMGRNVRLLTVSGRFDGS